MPKRIERLLSAVDALVTWSERAERLWWWLPMNVTITAAVFGGWTWFLDRPPEQIAISVLWAIGGMLIVLHYLPPWLRKLRQPSFTITTSTNSLSMRSTIVPISIVNRSKQDRLILNLTLRIPLSTGQEYQIAYEHTLTLGPQEDMKQEVSFIPKAPPLGPTFFFHEAYLLVYDNLSARSVRVKIPGSFPESIGTTPLRQ